MGARDSEAEYLAGLLRDFGVPGHPPVEEAFREIEARYGQLMASVEAMEPVSLAAVRRWNERAYSRFVCTVHEMLFGGLLTNAGRFRQPHEPESGRVHFGGPLRNEMRQKFTGSPPGQIESEVRETFTLLDGAADPVAASILCYQRFQRTHPFYDANGRIGRLFVTLYLLAHGFHLSWQLLDRHHGRFVQYLNHVHKRPEGDHSRSTHEEYLVQFWRKHATPLDEVYGQGQDVEPGSS